MSSVPLLLAGVLAFLVVAAARAARQGELAGRETRAVYALVGLFAAWGIASAGLALGGVYRSPSLLALLPGLWLPLVPVLLVGVAAAASVSLRLALPRFFRATPLAWLTALQALRILALGSVVKAFGGEFPVHFAAFVAVPDLLFGLSALVMLSRIRREAVSRRAIALWNTVGAAIIVLPAPLLIQMGLPGPLAIFREPPTTEALLEFPMVLAPSLLVPLFVLLNVGTAAVLFRSGGSLDQTCVRTPSSGMQ